MIYINDICHLYMIYIIYIICTYVQHIYMMCIHISYLLKTVLYSEIVVFYHFTLKYYLSYK